MSSFILIKNTDRKEIHNIGFIAEMLPNVYRVLAIIFFVLKKKYEKKVKLKDRKADIFTINVEFWNVHIKKKVMTFKRAGLNNTTRTFSELYWETKWDTFKKMKIKNEKLTM